MSQLTVFKATLTGICPLLMHSEILVDSMHPKVRVHKQLTAKKKKTEADLEAIKRSEWELGMYRDDDAPAVPVDWILASEAEACSLAKRWWSDRIRETSGMRDAKQSTHQTDRAAALKRKHEVSVARSEAMRERYQTQGNPIYGHILRKFDELGPVAFRAWLVSKIPAMRQTQIEEQVAVGYAAE